jgi:hypothetical protein
MEALMRHIEETHVAATESSDEDLMRMLLSPSSNAEFEEATAHPAVQMAVELAIKALLNRRQALRVGGIRRQYPERREKPKYWESPTGRQWRKWEAEADANEGCLGKKSAKDFRNRYRVPYEKAVEIISDCRDKYNLGPDPRHVARGTTAPLALLVLCSLRMLGRGSSPHDDHDHTFIHSNTIRAFFHKFCSAFVKHEKGTWLVAPATEDEIKRAVALYAQQGLNGVIGSGDCVHFAWGRCPAALQSGYIGKEGIPTVAYEVFVTHDRWIMHASRGFPGSWNDKTISRYDSFLSKLRDPNGPYANFSFELYTSATTKKRVKGLYAIVDGGYHKWRCLQCPFPDFRCLDGKGWSQKIESLRKDVECTFGILTQRFRILKLPQLWTPTDSRYPAEKMDNVFHLSARFFASSSRFFTSSFHMSSASLRRKSV